MIPKANNAAWLAEQERIAQVEKKNAEQEAAALKAKAAKEKEAAAAALKIKEKELRKPVH